jgi:hypothetical protein
MAELPDISHTETAIIERTNVFRREQGLAPVTRNPALEMAARQFAQYLARTGRFAHEADGRKPADRAKAAGYFYCTIAENLALNLDSRGFTVQKLSEETMEGWKKSPGHRKNLLLPNVTEIGVGIAQAPTAEPKFISVQLFGRPQSLSYEFRVVNTSPEVVSYTFAGQRHEIEPRVAVTHKTCETGKLQFSTKRLLSSSRIGEELEAGDKATFSLQSADDGKLSVVVRR